MPAWLLILLLIELLIIVCNPRQADFSWFQSLRRPSWLVFQSWTSLIRLVNHLGLYFAAVLLQARTGLWIWVLPSLLLILLVEMAIQLTCRLRRLGLGSLLIATSWLFGLLLFLVLIRPWPLAAALMVPFLIWSPIESVILWRMMSLNGIGRPLPPPPPPSLPEAEPAPRRRDRRRPPRRSR